MTAKSELFVTEEVRDLVEKKLGFNVFLEPEEDWEDLWTDAEFPDTGEATIYKEGDDERAHAIGSVSWKTTFEIVATDDGRYIEASVKPEDLEIKLEDQ